MSDWNDNPFAQDDSDNPFADPSVQQAQQPVPEYNPFDQPKSPGKAAPETVSSGAAAFGKQPQAAAAEEPAPAPGGSDDLPTWAQPASSKPAKAAPAQTQQPQAAPAGLDPEDAKYASTIKTLREAEYAERERKAAMQERNATQGRPPNFPNFPVWMRVGCFQPCFHLDIKAEIPILGQKVTRLAYYTWTLLTFSLFWNFVCTMAALAGKPNGKSVSCALAAAYFLLFSPCSYYCWFHQLYHALRVDSSLRFGWFFLVFGFQFVSSCFFAVGFQGTGAAGIWVATVVIDKSEGAGILIFSCAGLWIFNAILDLYVLKRVLTVYRMSGFTASDMQREALTNAASNQAVRKAAADAAFGGNDKA